MDRQCDKVSRGQGGWTWLDTRVWEKMTKRAGRVDMAGHMSVGENGQEGREGGEVAARGWNRSSHVTRGWEK